MAELPPPSTSPEPPPKPPPTAPIAALQASRVRHLLAALAPYPLCTLCLLRLCNVRNPDAYTTHSLPSLRQQLLALCPQLTAHPPAVCFTCLNVLVGLGERLAEVLASERYAQYEFNTVWCTSSLPATLLLRHVALSAHVLASQPPPSTDAATTLPATDIKDVLRALLSHILPALTPTPLLSAPSNSPHSIELQLVWSAPATTAEEWLMERHTHEIERRQRKKRYKPSDIVTTSNVLQAVPSITAQQATTLFRSYFRQPPTAAAEVGEGGGGVGIVCEEAAGFDFQLIRAPVLLMGNYIKHSRAISQSPWTVDDNDDAPPPPTPASSTTQTATTLVRPKSRITATSVEEELTRHLLPYFACSGHRFSSSGREDLDVRMLGDGRTFVLEIADAKRVPAADDATLWAAMQRSVNDNSDTISVASLRLCTKAQHKAMNASADTKCKRYRAIVHCTAALSEAALATLRALVFPLAVAQRTPVRVLHRRSAAVRGKVVHGMEVVVLNVHWLQIDVVTSAGMYVKEWVHGDRGRTVPSLSSLLGTLCECVQLDVTGLLHDGVDEKQKPIDSEVQTSTDADEQKSE